MPDGKTATAVGGGVVGAGLVVQWLWQLLDWALYALPYAPPPSMPEGVASVLGGVLSALVVYGIGRLPKQEGKDEKA